MPDARKGPKLGGRGTVSLFCSVRYCGSMLSGKTPNLLLVGVLWFCFFAKLVFYCSFVPLWEGYDEFSHYAFVEHFAITHSLPNARNTLPGDLAESLKLAPVPWTIRQWTTDWTSHDAFWHLPLDTRKVKERALKDLPRISVPNGSQIQLYEAQQPPLAYLVFWLWYPLLRNADLLTCAWMIRMAGAVIGSLVIPLGFLTARRILNNDLSALGVTALIASMPELFMLTDHGGNEPLAIVLATTAVYCLARKWHPALGIVLGCGLLTKAYFLTLIPAIAVIYAMRWWRQPLARMRIASQLLIVFGTALAIAGWWYGHALYATGTLTGDQVAIAARRSTISSLSAMTSIHWLRVADFTLFTHIWLGGWSFLVLRTWMYRVFEVILAAAVVGLLVKLRKLASSPIAICLMLLFFFWAGLAWQALVGFRATGEAGVAGYYAYALVVPEALCLVCGLSALVPLLLRRWIAPALVICFSAAEIFGAVFFLMPYYAGATAHNASGNVPAMHLDQFSAQVFRNLAVNKTDFITPAVLWTLFVLFLAAMLGIIAVSVIVSLRESVEPGARPPNRFVPLGAG
jgi:hypothetical protein